MGSLGNVELFDGTAGSAKELLRQRHDIVANRHTEEVWNNCIETYGLLNVGITFPAINLVDVR